MLDSLLASVRDHSREFTVYRGDEQTDLETQFAAHSVEIAHRQLPPHGPEPFVIVEEDGEFAGAVPVGSLERLLEPPVVRPPEPGDVSEGYRVLFEILDETVFTAMGRRQLLTVSREIEERAFRTGAGTLRVGFQTLSAFEPQVEVYRTLATDTALDIHIYAVDDWSPPHISGVTYYDYAENTHERYWVLAFDGGGDESRACGLVAQQRGDEYDGFWSDDPAVVADITAALTDE